MVRAKNVELAYIEEQSGEIVIGQSADYFGSSTDTKPTDKVVGGSTFIETDTGNFYYFDENSSTWVKKNESGGGGGGSDFGIANMTFINSRENSRYNVRHLIGVDDELEKIVYIEDSEVDYNYPITIPLILYKGKYIINVTNDITEVDTSVMPTMTGDIEMVQIDGRACLQVTGDATLTAAGESVV